MRGRPPAKLARCLIASRPTRIAPPPRKPGRWRLREFGNPVDSRGDYYDGTPISSPAELKAVLLKRPAPLLRTFTANLMAYALGRRIEYYDQPAIRKITAAAEVNGYRINDFIVGVVLSDAFRMRRVADTPAAGTGQP